MARFRFEGKAMSKFDMACVMGNWHSMPCDILCDSLDYDFMVSRFKAFLLENQYKNDIKINEKI